MHHRIMKAVANHAYRAKGFSFTDDPGDATAEDYRIVFMLSGSRCEYCEKSVSFHNFHFDHIMPLCRGGKNTRSNLAIACVDCNQAKSYKLPTKFAFEQKLKGITTKLVDRLIAESDADPDRAR